MMKKKINVFLCTTLLLSFMILGACPTCYGAAKANSVTLQVVPDSDDIDHDEDNGVDLSGQDEESDDSDEVDTDDDGDEHAAVAITLPASHQKPGMQAALLADQIDEDVDDEDDVE